VRGRGTYERDKPPIITLVSRESKQVIIAPSAHAGSEEVVKRAVKNVEPETTIYHDDHRSYNVLSGLFRHDSVNHSQHEYARGDVHINTVEAEFSVFRPWIATYRGASKEKLYLYCSQYQFLGNTRRMDRVNRASSMLLPRANEHVHPLAGDPVSIVFNVPIPS